MTERQEQICTELVLIESEIKALSTLFTAIGHFQVNATDLFGVGLILRTSSARLTKIARELGFEDEDSETNVLPLHSLSKDHISDYE